MTANSKEKRFFSKALQALASVIAPPEKERHAPITFRSAGVLTLGVEMELQLIDPDTLYLAPKAEELLKALSGYAKVKPELYRDMIEIVTGKCNNAFEIEKDLNETVTKLDAACRKLGITLSGTGSHPLSGYDDGGIFPSERYNDLIDRNQWLTRQWKVYGLHVHIGMESGDDCIRFNNFFMQLLPCLLALSNSAPFWQGKDTGLATCRPSIYEALPTAGLPYYVQSWQEFSYLCTTLRECRAIKSLKDLWWDLRPSPEYGTLEIRVCDVPATITEAAAITAFIHALAHWFRHHGGWLHQIPQPPHWLMRENKWRVIRHGLAADLVTSPHGENRPVREEIMKWLEKIAPYSDELGYTYYMDIIANICEKGTSSTRQRAIFERCKSLEAVVKHNIEEFEHGMPLWDDQDDFPRKSIAAGK
jgi:carboxylate-amine ligase